MHRNPQDRFWHDVLVVVALFGALWWVGYCHTSSRDAVRHSYGAVQLRAGRSPEIDHGVLAALGILGATVAEAAKRLGPLPELNATDRRYVNRWVDGNVHMMQTISLRFREGSAELFSVSIPELVPRWVTVVEGMFFPLLGILEPWHLFADVNYGKYVRMFPEGIWSMLGGLVWVLASIALWVGGLFAGASHRAAWIGTWVLLGYITAGELAVGLLMNLGYVRAPTL